MGWIASEAEGTKGILSDFASDSALIGGLRNQEETCDLDSFAEIHDECRQYSGPYLDC